MGSRITTHNLDGTISVSDTRTIDDARAEAAQRLEGHFAALIVAGRNYAGHNYQIDDASRANINAAATMAMVAPDAWSGDFYWIASDNSHVPMTAAEVIAFGLNAGDYYTAMIFTNRAHKDAIAALTTISTCDAYDVTAGWPANDAGA
ncbi:MAG: DUF4376 domain-containing protein [Alphaproteobacteria bacterium]|nr:DUF4376 domain-containing protein [Alphaproteobacteria bacterium]